MFFRHGKFKFFAPKRDKIIKYFSYQAHTYIGYCKSSNIRNSKFPSNDKGFASKKNFSFKKNENTIRLMVCGGSTVEQNDIDQTEPFDEDITWPKVLENELNKKKSKNFEVINAGCAGYSILESTVHMLTKGITTSLIMQFYIRILTMLGISNLHKDLKKIIHTPDNIQIFQN